MTKEKVIEGIIGEFNLNVFVCEYSKGVVIDRTIHINPVIHLIQKLKVNEYYR